MNYNLYNSEDFAADESFIAYYHKSNATAIAFWTDWIAHHPEKLDEIYNAERLLAKFSFRLSEEELQTAFNNFDNFLESTKSPTLQLAEAPKTTFHFKRLALAAILCLVFSLIGYQLYEKKYNQLEYLTTQNGNSKLTEIFLSDGTKVYLNCNSTIKYPKIFKGNLRHVILNGEAFFEVAKDKTKPFTVFANGVKTVVLGTKFNVSAYKNMPNVNIALVEGKVEVQTEGGRDKMILKPSEMASFNTRSTILTRSQFNLSAVSSWRNGSIVFEDSSFEEVAAKLTNRYGIHLIDQTKGVKWNYSGQFDHADYLTIIKSICFAKKINYKQTNQTFILTN